MSTTSKYWCWTWNNYTNDDVEELKKLDKNSLDFIVFGKEVGDSGTRHLQGYSEFKNKISMTAAKKILDPTHGTKSKIHLEIRLAKDRSDAINYCKKGEQPHAEWDGYKEKGSFFGLNADFYEKAFKVYAEHKGERTDWHIFREDMKSMSLEELLDAHPEKAIKNFNAVKSIKNALEISTAKSNLLDSFKDLHLYPWQEKVEALLSKKPDSRKVYWFWDDCGNTGKTELARYLSVVRNACYLTNAKTSDVALRWNGESIVIFDFAKSLEHEVNYEALECLKNGIVFSPKYNSTTKEFCRPHVICFANFAPAIGALMKDRWVVKQLYPQDCTIPDEKVDPPNAYWAYPDDKKESKRHPNEGDKVDKSYKLDNLIYDDLDDL